MTFSWPLAHPGGVCPEKWCVEVAKALPQEAAFSRIGNSPSWGRRVLRTLADEHSKLAAEENHSFILCHQRRDKERGKKGLIGQPLIGCILCCRHQVSVEVQTRGRAGTAAAAAAAGGTLIPVLQTPRALPWLTS
ncbi:uncharacterized protein LOC144577557 isoform X1 [Callithrix jacchus]